MAPKKVVSEEKKKLAPSGGLSTQKFFGKRVHAAPASGEQAESSSPASTAAAQPKPKPMSSSEAVTAIMATPTSSDAELDLTLSQSSTQSVQETEQSGDQAQSAQLPDVGAEQDVEISVAQDPPPTESLATRYPARKRKGTSSTPQSSPSTTSDDGDMDMDWTPAESGRGEETGGQGKRKVPESLRVMEDDDDDEEHDDDEPVIVAVDIGDSNIAVPRVAPPASIFLKPQQRPTVTTASVEDIPPAQSQSQKTHPTTTSTSSSGFSSSLSTKKFRSPVWDFFTVSKDGEHIAVCTLCHKEVRRGKPGTHLGTGGQLTHLKNNHAIRWEQHLKNIAERSPCVEGEGSRGTSAASEIIVVVGGGDEEEESDILLTVPSTPVSSSLSAQCPATPTSATSQWHKTHSERVVKRVLSLPAPTVPKSAASVAPQKIKKNTGYYS